MNITGKCERIIPNFKQKVKTNPKYKRYMWDYPQNIAPLETYILRILTYGDFNVIKWVCKKFELGALANTNDNQPLSQSVKILVNQVK